MGMGTRNQVQPDQVFFDPQTNQYYTQGQGAFGNGINGLGMYYTKNYIADPFQNKQVSPINELLAKAQAAQASAPTMSQLFGGALGGGIMSGSQPFGNPSYGAGRFLGAGSVPLNTSLTTNTSNK